MHLWMNLKMKKSKFLLYLISILVLLIGGSFIYFNNQLQATNLRDGVLFSIESGESASSVINRLEDEKLIKSADVGKIFLRINNQYSFKAGTYELNGYMNLDDIFELISNSSMAMNDDVVITFIEGDWVKHIAEKIEENLDVTADELLTLWNDEQYIRSLMVDYPFITEDIFNEESRYYLEGYLMPDTYYFAKESDADVITRRILDQSLNVYDKYKVDIDNSGFSIHEVYTLASIVQYEAASVEDMKMISGVFLNRIEISMPLESSVTVCYAIDIDKDGDWRDCETNPDFDSAYNTYKVGGLPPGPILNAGEDAIASVLYPTESNYYFFLADVYGDGTVYYSENYQQHLEYKRKYLD